MKTIFITGASAGLGKAAVKLFVEKGWNVIATMRTPEKEQELQKLKHVTILPLDVTNSEQINSTIEKAISMGKIDVVFNNAGYGLMGPLEASSDKQITGQINTNLLGVINVTKAFIPHFRENKGGLFITTTSIGGLITVPFASVYHATKWALEGFNEGLAFELKQFGIRIKTVEPGAIVSDFAGRSLDYAQHEVYSASFSAMSNEIAKPSSIFKYSTAEQIAEVVYEAVMDPKEQLRYVAGEDARSLYAQRLDQGDETFRSGIAKMLLG